jgi:hypothetical protein
MAIKIPDLVENGFRYLHIHRYLYVQRLRTKYVMPSYFYTKVQNYLTI